MGTIRRLIKTAGWATIIAAFGAALGHSAPETLDDNSWISSLKAIRVMAMARQAPRPIRTAILKQGPAARPTPRPTPTAEPAPVPPQPVETSVDLAAAFNKHLKTRLTFQANGWNIWASAGLNPDNPDGDYLILRVEDKASIVFDIRQMITLTEQLKPFAVNGVPLVLVGDPVFTRASPERDSTLTVALNVARPDLQFTEPKAGKALLPAFSMQDFRKALWDAGTAVNLGGEEIRFYYGDQVSKGERRLQTGPGKGFAFIRKLGEEKFSHAVLLNEDKLPAGGSVTIVLAKDLTLRLVRTDENTLKISKETTSK